MEPIYPITSLQRNIGEVKTAAQDSMVRITEQGGGPYVFGSEEAFERRIAREREDAAFEARLEEATSRGLIDISAGRYTTSIDEAFANARSMRPVYA